MFLTAFLFRFWIQFRVRERSGERRRGRKSGEDEQIFGKLYRTKTNQRLTRRIAKSTNYGCYIEDISECIGIPQLIAQVEK